MKNLLNFNGTQKLSKTELLSINGGKECNSHPPVPPGHGVCVVGKCLFVYACDSICPDGTDPICHN